MDSTTWKNKQKFKDIFLNRISQVLQANKPPDTDENDELVVMCNGMYAQGLDKMSIKAYELFDQIGEELVIDVINTLKSEIRENILAEMVKGQTTDHPTKQIDVIKYKIEFLKAMRKDFRDNLTALKVLLQDGNLTIVAINKMIMSVDKEMLRKLSALSVDLSDGDQNDN